MASIIGRPLGRPLQRFFSSSTTFTTSSTTTTTTAGKLSRALPHHPAPSRTISRTYFSSTIPSSVHPPRSALRQSFFSPRLSLPNATARLRTPPRRNFSSTTRSRGPSDSPASSTVAEPTSLSARLKKLSKEYGYAALGVYLGLSALDFPFCFLAVRYLGTERIRYFEDQVVSTFKAGLAYLEQLVGIELRPRKAAVLGGEGEEAREVSDLEEAQVEAAKEGASLWTELVLAYAIHKSFIFIRVPLTAAVTPKVVKVLRGWGFDIGRKGGVREGMRELKRKAD